MDKPKRKQHWSTKPASKRQKFDDDGNVVPIEETTAAESTSTGAESGDTKPKGHRYTPKPTTFEPGTAGILFTVGGKQPNIKWAMTETYKLLESYVEKLKPQFVNNETETNATTADTCSPGETHTNKPDSASQANAPDSASSATGSDSDQDIADSLRKEVEQTKKTFVKGPFRKLPSKIKNLLVMNDGGLTDVTGFVHDVLEDLNREGVTFSCRHLQRMVPFETSCKSRPEDLTKCLENALPKHFSKRDPPPSYAVYFKSRSQANLDRQHAIQAVTDIVQAVSPLSRVNLTCPDIAVVVETLANRTCIAVLRDYAKLRRYSLQPVEMKQGDHRKQ